MNEELAKQIYENKVFIAKGKRGFVYLSNFKNKKYLIKKKNPNSTANRTIENESEFNVRLNTLGVGPKFYYKDLENKYLIREYVEGLNIYEWIKKEKEILKLNANRTKDTSDKIKEHKNYINTFKKMHIELKKILVKILKQLFIMDKVGINKQEMTHPHKDVIITIKNIPYIIDFERCRFSSKPKNVTQFCQFLAKGKFNVQLRNFNFHFNSEVLLAYATKYKQENYSKKYFEKIIDYL